MGIVSSIRPYGVHQWPGVFKLLATLQADLVGPFLDREHTTMLAVMAPEGKHWKTRSSGFINLPLDAGARDFHWHPANLVENAR